MYCVRHAARHGFDSLSSSLIVHGPRPEFIRLTRVFRGIYRPTNSGVHAGSSNFVNARQLQHFPASLWQREGRMTNNFMISMNSYQYRRPHRDYKMYQFARKSLVIVQGTLSSNDSVSH